MNNFFSVFLHFFMSKTPKDIYYKNLHNFFSSGCAEAFFLHVLHPLDSETAINFLCLSSVFCILSSVVCPSVIRQQTTTIITAVKFTSLNSKFIFHEKSKLFNLTWHDISSGNSSLSKMWVIFLCDLISIIITFFLLLFNLFQFFLLFFPPS